MGAAQHVKTLSSIRVHMTRCRAGRLFTHGGGVVETAWLAGM